ncbi:MAG: GFA family protein [Erythrobacter sp.]
MSGKDISAPSSDLVMVTGGCHCGKVRFSAEIERGPEILRCNCSICAPCGFLHLIVPHSHFTLQSDRAHLSAYRFGTQQAEHLFCKACGIKSFYQPRSHPDCWSVHFACLDEGHDIAPNITEFDGKNWEQAAENL